MIASKLRETKAKNALKLFFLSEEEGVVRIDGEERVNHLLTMVRPKLFIDREPDFFSTYKSADPCPRGPFNMIVFTGRPKISSAMIAVEELEVFVFSTVSMAE